LNVVRKELARNGERHNRSLPEFVDSGDSVPRANS
jgi:hypothetical protein